MVTRNVAVCDPCGKEIRKPDAESKVIRIGYRDMRPEDFHRFDVCDECAEDNVAAKLFAAEVADRASGEGLMR